MLTSLRTRSRTDRAQHRRARPVAEGLEGRMLLYATLGAQWTHGSRIMYSFVPDGTDIGGVPSAWFRAMSSRGIATATWQQEFQKAAALWENVAGINLVQVSDDGSRYYTTGNQQGDARFGNIRIGGIALGTCTLAVAYSPPPINGGTIAGDIIMNTTSTWNVNNSYDIESVALHEFGHALGLDHSAISNAVMYAYYTTVKQNLNADDTAGLQSIYGTRPGDTFEPNNANIVAANITSRIDANKQISIPNLDISSYSDNDFFSVVVPANTTGTMVVKMQATGLSSLAPQILVYNSALRLAGSAVAYSYGDTATVTITRVVAGQTYYFRALDANGGPGGVGAYGLQVNFGSQPQAPIPPPDTVVPEQPDQVGSSSNSITTAPGAISFDALRGVLTNSGIPLQGWRRALGLLGVYSLGANARITIGSLSGWGDALMASPWAPPRALPVVTQAPIASPLPGPVFLTPSVGGAILTGPIDASVQPSRPRGRIDPATLDAILDTWGLSATDC